MNSLKNIYRGMMLVWLLLVLALGVMVSYSTHSNYFANALSFMMPRQSEAPADIFVAAHRPELPQPEPEPEPDPEPEPEPIPEWTELNVGKTLGAGQLGAPVISVQGETVFVLLPLNGTVGDVSYYRPTNVTGMSADFKGDWGKKTPFINQKRNMGCLARVQVAGHKGFVRVSGTARDGIARIEAAAEYSQSQNAVRVVFRPAQN